MNEGEIGLGEQLEHSLRIVVKIGWNEEFRSCTDQFRAIHDRRGRAEHANALEQVQSACVPTGHDDGCGIHTCAQYLLAGETIGGNNPDAAVFIQNVRHVGQTAIENPVIRLHDLAVPTILRNLFERKIVVIGLGQQLRCPHHANSSISFCIIQSNLAAAVGALIVHQEVFKIAIALIQHALDALGKKAGGIEEGRDYADQRLGVRHEDGGAPIGGASQYAGCGLG